MKKSLVILLICVCTVSIKAQSNWNFGVQLAALGNHSEFSGGMSDANALFSNTPYATGQFGMYARRTISNHFSLQSGIDFTSIGFSYSIAQDYSLTNMEERYGNELRTGACVARIPVSFIYNSKLNCRNVRFIAGLGLAASFVDEDWETEKVKEIEDGEFGNTSSSIMQTEVRAKNNVSASLTSLIGVEKVFSRGNMLSFTFQGNCGFNTLAESSASYTVDNKFYNHTFSNNGSFCGFAITYYLAPLGTPSRKAAKKIPAVAN